MLSMERTLFGRLRCPSLPAVPTCRSQALHCHLGSSCPHRSNLPTCVPRLRQPPYPTAHPRLSCSAWREQDADVAARVSPGTSSVTPAVPSRRLNGPAGLCADLLSTPTAGDVTAVSLSATAVNASLSANEALELSLMQLASASSKSTLSARGSRNAASVQTRPSGSRDDSPATQIVSLPLLSEDTSSSSSSATESEHKAALYVGNPLASLYDALKNKFSPRVRGLILLNILTFLYGSNVTVVKDAESILDPFSFSAGRFVIAAAAFTPFLMTALKDKKLRAAGVELGIWASLAYITQAVGLLTTDAGRAAFIGTFTVIEVPIIAGFFGAHIPPVTWWSAAAAVMGVALLETSGGNSSLMGDFWTIISALIFGIHMLRSEHHARHVPENGALPLISLQLTVTAIMSAVWMAAMGSTGHMEVAAWDAIVNSDWSTVASWPWLQMTYTGVLSTAFCLWVEVVSLRDVSASEAAMVYTLEPLYGAAFAWILLGERWGPAGWFGAALILGGSVTMQLYGRVEPAEELEDQAAENQSSALLTALGAAAAISLVMAATSVSAPGTASALTRPGPLVEVPLTLSGKTLSGLKEAVWSGEDDEVERIMALEEADIDNLTTFMRAYALVKGDGSKGDDADGEQ